MNCPDTNLDASEPANSGRDNERYAALHAQLCRYAEDLMELIERNGQLENNYQELLDSSTRLMDSYAENRLAYLAHHDTLTDLPNRLLLQERIGQTLLQARRSSGNFTLIFIDLDRFKEVNDRLGHEVGDEVLQETAKRLNAAVRENDTVARLGGDEFVILAPDLNGDERIGILCAKIIEILGRNIQVETEQITIGGSLGCAEYPRHGEDETTLLKHADIAMYQAKSAGGNCHVIYHPTQSATHKSLDFMANEANKNAQ